MSFREKLNASEKKRLLALDGGGIRGMITLEFLAEIESVLRQKTGKPDLVLADYFDYVAGTSTGAIIAACIALGMSVDTITRFYEDNGKAMFDKASLLRRFRYKYEDQKLAAKLREVIRAETGTQSDEPDPTLGSEKLRTLLMMVMRNASTDSPWPVSSNPAAKYNLAGRADRNLDLPLWQLVRASTAAPVYFPPEIVRIGAKEFIFVDGGLTTYNNPAFILFIMATHGPYNLNWPAGEDRMLLVSVGTGSNPKANENLDPDEMNLLFNAASVPSALMYAALNEQDMLCRVFGRCRAGGSLDREIGDLCAATGPVEPRLFTYMRYNCELSREALDELGLPHVKPENVQRLDSIEHMHQLREVGRTAAKKTVSAEHFAGF